MSRRKRFLITILILAVVSAAIGLFVLPPSYFWNRTRPAPTPLTITTNSGGTSATYQVQESTSAEPDSKCQKPAPEIVFYTVSPSSVAPGEKAVLSWEVRGAKFVKVAGQTFSSAPDNTGRGSLEVQPLGELKSSGGRGRAKLADGKPYAQQFPLVAYADEGCAPVEANVTATLKQKDKE